VSWVARFCFELDADRAAWRHASAAGAAEREIAVHARREAA
jgi:hypothetical protein